MLMTASDIHIPHRPRPPVTEGKGQKFKQFVASEKQAAVNEAKNQDEVFFKTALLVYTVRSGLIIQSCF